MFTNIVKKLLDVSLRVDTEIEKRIGFSPSEKLVEMDEKDEELRSQEPLKWTVKKIATGTIKGLLGNFFS